MESKASEQRKRLQQAVDALESQRAILGDRAVEAALASLRDELAEAERDDVRPTQEPVSERKLVTIMFADISSFTMMSETLDPEATREMMNELFDALVPVIEKYDGTVDKFIGDEVMALFGAPKAHEDDPERALQTALEMMESLEDFNSRKNTDIKMHIGINTGLVIAGLIGSERRQQYSVMGDAVNLASRLTEASGEGEVYVGHDTYRLTSQQFDFESLGPIQLAGRAEPAKAYRLNARKSIRRRIRGIDGLQSTLVGREYETEQMKDIVKALQDGRGSIASIISDVGVGKSRLVAEIRKTLPHDIVWVEGRALSSTQGSSYWVVRDILRGLLELDTDASREKAAMALGQSIKSVFDEGEQETVFPYLAHLMDLPLDEATASKIGQFGPIELQRRICEAFSRYVSKRSDKPLVLVWEDLHWADQSSLRLIESLPSLANELPLLLVFVLRPEEGPTLDLVQELCEVHAENHIVLRLQPLDEDDSIVLLKNLLRIESLPAQIQTIVLGKAEGNPLFIEEILRSLIDMGVILLKEDGIEIPEASLDSISVDIPDTLQGVIAARIDRLPGNDKHTLQTAAIIGRIFQRHVLEHILDGELPSGQLKPSLGRLRRHEFIRLREAADTGQMLADQEYIFKHVLTREMAYSSIPIIQRKQLHRKAGEAIETLFPQRLDELSATVAYHFERAGMPDKAVAYLHRAGNHAVKLSANDEAVNHYSKGLVLLQTIPDKSNIELRELQLQLPLAVSLMNIRGYGSSEVINAFTRARDLCDQIGDTPEIAVALHGMGAYYCAKMEFETAIELANRIIRIADKAPDPVPLLLVGHNGQSANMSLVGESELALKHAQQVFDLYDPQKHRSMAYILGVDLKIVSMSYTGLNLWIRGYPDQARKIIRDVVSHCREVAHPPSSCFALWFVAKVYYQCGDTSEFRKYLDELMQTSREYGLVLFDGQGATLEGWSKCEQGKIPEGIAEMDQSIASFQKAGVRTFEAFNSTLLADWYCRTGALDKGFAVLQEALSLVERGGRMYESEIHRLIGECLHLQGENDAIVEKHYMKAIQVAQRQSAKSLELRAVMSLSRLWRKQGRNEEALKMLRQTYDWFSEGFDTADLKEAALLLEDLSRK
jgi:class 3 adenylate cyclase/tetratricopeptide (TPR) repeat protein